MNLAFFSSSTRSSTDSYVVMLTFTRPFHASSTRARLLAILLLILDANGSAEAIGASCPPGRFLRNVSAVYCDGMTGVEAPESAEACANYCCANSTCGVWLWCPDSGNGGGCTQWRSKRCHIGPSSTACSTQSHWFGQSDTPPPPTPPAPPPVTRKRGFSGFLGPEYTCDDAAALSLDNSWFYNWLHVPSQYGNCNGKRQAAEYVPMVIGINATVAPDTPAIWEAANARYLLGYNEPDFGNGHNHPHMCSPEEAAKDWHRLQSLATSTSPPLELVSPAVSTTGVNHNGESSWLDRFFANCTVAVGCDPTMIKYVAFHDYSGDPQLILARAEGMYKRYQRKVWITEFAVLKWSCSMCNVTRNMTDTYMEKVLPLLDASDAVFRYAWFSARNPSTPDVMASNLLPTDSNSTEQTTTGQIYANP